MDAANEVTDVNELVVERPILPSEKTWRKMGSKKKLRIAAVLLLDALDHEYIETQRSVNTTRSIALLREVLQITT